MPSASDLPTVALIRRMAGDGAARQIREQARLSLHDVAAAVGVADSTVCRWETGKRLPRGELALRYAAALAEVAVVAVAVSREGP